jgi:site-specific DNA recombinase
MTPPIACITYAAKSTVDEKNSLGRQAADCAAAIGRLGGREVLCEFRDEDESAYKGDRGPGLAAAMCEAERTVVDRGECELWVQHSDRLARGAGDRPGAPRHLVEVVIWARRTGVRLRSVQDDDSVGSLLLAVVMGDRNYEDSRRKSEAVKSGKRGQFDRGERLGGPVCDGYKLVRGDDGRGRAVTDYVFDPDRETPIRMMFDLLLQGLADRKVADALNAAGYRTPVRVGKDGRVRGGRPWRRRTVQDKALNAFYAGMVVRNRTDPDAEEEMVPGRHPGYITLDQLSELKRIRAARDRVRGTSGEAARRPERRGRRPTHFALARLARCGRCGQGMYCHSSTYVRKDGTKRRQYVCPDHKEGTGSCDQKPILREVVDRGIVGHLSSLLVDFDAWLARETNRLAGQRDRLQAQIDADDAELAALEREQADVTADYRARRRAGYSAAADVAAAALEQISQQRAETGRRLAAQRDALAELAGGAPADAMLDFYNALCAAVRGSLHGAVTLGDINERLQDLFEAFEIDRTPDGIRVVPRLRDGVYAELVETGGGWAHLHTAEGAVGRGFPTTLTGVETLTPLLRAIGSGSGLDSTLRPPLATAMLDET